MTRQTRKSWVRGPTFPRRGAFGGAASGRSSTRRWGSTRWRVGRCCSRRGTTQCCAGQYFAGW